jgi:uncharacterized membrane protein
MYHNYLDILVHLHSVGRWLLLLLLLIAIFRSATAGNRNFTPGDQRIGTVLVIFTDLMLVIGLYLYFAGNWGKAQIDALGGMGEVMKSPTARFFAIEHLVGMLIAIVLIHIGKAQGKRNLPHKTKHKRTFVFYLLALIVAIASVPWPFREIGQGRGWF